MLYLILNQCLNAVAFAASKGCVIQTIPDNSTVLVKFEELFKSSLY